MGENSLLDARLRGLADLIQVNGSMISRLEGIIEDRSQMASDSSQDLNKKFNPLNLAGVLDHYCEEMQGGNKILLGMIERLDEIVGEIKIY